MKRDLVLKGAGGHFILEQAVRNPSWASRTEMKQGCQERVDAKAFKGKGGLALLRQSISSLQGVESQMRELATISKSVKDLGIYLVVHQRSASGYIFLRWRARLGSNRHLSWEEAAAHGATLPQEFGVWIRTASIQAQQLNAKHLQIRDELKVLKKQLGERESHLYPRGVDASR